MVGQEGGRRRGGGMWDRREIIFGQMKLNENNFTSCVWWALIEEIAPRAEEMAGEKEMAGVRGYHVYKDIWAAAIREVLVTVVCSRKNFRIFA